MRFFLLALLVTTSATGADTTDAAKPVTPPSKTPPSKDAIRAFRGQTVTLVASKMTMGKPVQLKVTDKSTKTPAKSNGQSSDTNKEPETHDITGMPTSTESLAFVVPPDLPFGTWEISTSDGVEINSIPASVEVQPKVPTVSAVAPQVLYPGSPKQFTAIGTDFVESDADYYLQFLDAKSPLKCDPNKTGADPKIPCYSVIVSADHQQLTFTFPESADLLTYAGKRQFAVSVGGKDSNATAITFSRVAAETPRYWAWAILAGIILIIYLILRAGEKNVEVKVDEKTYFLSALFLDKATNTYSLSQCQFYAWTGASILGYIYLTTAKSMIQGSVAFPDIPSGLPGILLASAGTTVLAAGITSSKGNKGAGEIHPSLADFIATGGVVAAERLQFVVWTIVGVVTFVRLVLLSDPATIDGLPEIPSGFLQLMGISSAGYLGGKLARKAGPTITEVNACVDSAGSLILEMKGNGLSQNASFSIGNDPVPQSQISGDQTLDSAGQPRHLPEIVQKDDTNNEPGFAKVLKVTITSPKDAWKQSNAPLKFKITNPDQQEAVKDSTVGPCPPALPPAAPPPVVPPPAVPPPAAPPAAAAVPATHLVDDGAVDGGVVK